MSKEEYRPPRAVVFVLVLLGLGILAALGYAVYSIGSAFSEGWEEVGEIRSEDAALVRAQREAGRRYMENLALELSTEKITRGVREVLRLTFKIRNEGSSEVLKVKGRVTIPSASGGEGYSEEFTLLDNTPLSVRPDSSLAPGQERTLTRDADFSDTWDLGNAEAEITEVRVPAEPSSEGEEAAPASEKPAAPSALEPAAPAPEPEAGGEPAAPAPGEETGAPAPESREASSAGQEAPDSAVEAAGGREAGGSGEGEVEAAPESAEAAAPAREGGAASSESEETAP